MGALVLGALALSLAIASCDDDAGGGPERYARGHLAPSVETMKLGQEATTPARWAAFARKYRAEMSQPDAAHALALLAVLSQSANFSIGCYCPEETRRHRSILRELLVEKDHLAAASHCRRWPFRGSAGSRT